MRKKIYRMKACIVVAKSQSVLLTLELVYHTAFAVNIVIYFFLFIIGLCTVISPISMKIVLK